MSNVEFLPSVVSTPEKIDYNKSNDWPDIPAQTKLFCISLVDGSFSSACKKAGLSRERAQRIMRDPLVDAYINNLSEYLVKRSIFDAEFVELGYLETYEQANGERDVANVNKDGEVVWGPRHNLTAKIQVLRDISEHLHMKKPKGIDGNGVTINLNMGDFTGRGPEVVIEHESDPT